MRSELLCHVKFIWWLAGLRHDFSAAFTLHKLRPIGGRRTSSQLTLLHYHQNFSTQFICFHYNSCFLVKGMPPQLSQSYHNHQSWSRLLQENAIVNFCKIKVAKIKHTVIKIATIKNAIIQHLVIIIGISFSSKMLIQRR